MPGIEETNMNFTHMRGIVRAIAVVLSLAVPLVIAISSAAYGCSGCAEF